EMRVAEQLGLDARRDRDQRLESLGVREGVCAGEVTALAVAQQRDPAGSDGILRAHGGDAEVEMVPHFRERRGEIVLIAGVLVPRVTDPRRLLLAHLDRKGPVETKQRETRVDE